MKRSISDIYTEFNDLLDIINHDNKLKKNDLSHVDCVCWAVEDC